MAEGATQKRNPANRPHGRRPPRDGEDDRTTPRDLINRLPPHSVEAEKGVLGSILLMPEVMDDVAPMLRPTMFYDGAHDLLFSLMLTLHADGKPIDPTLLAERLKAMPGSGRESAYELVGGVAYIAELVQAVPHAASAVYYAEIVRDKAMKRGLLYAATDILHKVGDESETADDLLAFAEEKVSAVHGEKSSLAVQPIGLVLADQRRRRATHGEDGVPSLDTGFRELDRQVRVNPGWLIILAGRPSHGKTTLAMNIALNVAKRGSDGDVLFVSREMTPDEICDKMLSAESGVLLDDIVDGTMNDKDREYFMAASRRISEANLYLDDARGQPRRASDIVAVARRHQRREGTLALVVVDYLGLLQSEPGRYANLNEEIGKMAYVLKQGAMALQVPILCLAQLNRENEKTGARPRLHNLRDSGAIEQHADAVWFVHRPHFAEEAERQKANTTSRDTFAEIIVAKQRIGGTGMVKLGWQGAVSRFVDRRDLGPNEAPLFETVDEEF